jgi:hypothetical protein
MCWIILVRNLPDSCDIRRKVGIFTFILFRFESGCQVLTPMVACLIEISKKSTKLTIEERNAPYQECADRLLLNRFHDVIVCLEGVVEFRETEYLKIAPPTGWGWVITVCHGEGCRSGRRETDREVSE